jgi:hypothetical protein
MVGCQAWDPGGRNTSGAGGSAGAASSSSASGEPACSGCWEYLQSQASPDRVCGFDASTQACAPSSSCARVVELRDCVCGGELGGGQCVAFCEVSCTGVGIDDGCSECMQTACGAAYDACVEDP